MFLATSMAPVATTNDAFSGKSTGQASIFLTVNEFTIGYEHNGRGIFRKITNSRMAGI
jgi:hypothetical protein